MARPKCCRTIGEKPLFRVFRPIGSLGPVLEEIVLTMDELEAIRLADLEGMYQEQAAESMNVSRQTFGRIVQSARHKVAEALVDGLAIRVQGGAVRLAEERTFECAWCRDSWSVPSGVDMPQTCPRCKHAQSLKQE